MWTDDAIETQTSLIEGPTLEPLDLEEVRKHLRFGSTMEDTLLDQWISAARQYFEEQTGRQLLTATWEYWLDEFPGWAIELPAPPLQSVVSVKYIDAAGTLQTVASADYLVKAPQGPRSARGTVEPAYGKTWPYPRYEAGAVRVQFKAGYGNAPGDVPELVKTILYFLVGHFHLNRAEVETGSPVHLPIGASAMIGGFVSRPTREPRYAA